MQHDELIERLRVWRRSEFGRSQPGYLFEAAADALQSQAAEIAHWKEQAALWKQSEETASRQHDKRAAEIARLREECQAQYDRGYYDGRAALSGDER